VLVTDIGYGDTKFGWYEDGRIKLGKFPTAIVRRGRYKPQYQDFNIDMESKEFVYQGFRYMVGEDAFMSGIPLCTRKRGFIPNYAPLLIAKIIRDYKKTFRDLIVSVSVSDYKKEYVTELKKALKRFMVNGTTYSFGEILILPQGYGIFRDVFPGKVYEPTVVVDIGFNTIDVSIYNKGKLLREGFLGFPGYGTNRLIQNISERVKEEIGEQLSELELNEAIKKGGIIRLYGREYDISDLIEEEKEFFIEDVISLIETSSIGSFWKRAKFRIVAGGGGYFISDAMKNSFNLIVPERPEFSNVRGFFNVVKEGYYEE